MPPQRKLKWKAYEYRHTEKGNDWYWALGIIAVSLAVTAVLFDNLLFAVVIVIASFSLALYAKRPPALIEVEANEREIKVGKASYAYASIKSFWVEEHPHEARLLLKPKKVTAPLVAVDIEKSVPANLVREFIHQYVDEEELAEPLSQKIMEYLGF